YGDLRPFAAQKFRKDSHAGRDVDAFEPRFGQTRATAVVEAGRHADAFPGTPVDAQGRQTGRAAGLRQAIQKGVRRRIVSLTRRAPWPTSQRATSRPKAPRPPVIR